MHACSYTLHYQTYIIIKTFHTCNILVCMCVRMCVCGMVCVWYGVYVHSVCVLMVQGTAEFIAPLITCTGMGPRPKTELVNRCKEQCHPSSFLGRATVSKCMIVASENLLDQANSFITLSPAAIHGQDY